MANTISAGDTVYVNISGNLTGLRKSLSEANSLAQKEAQGISLAIVSSLDSCAGSVKSLQDILSVSREGFSKLDASIQTLALNLQNLNSSNGSFLASSMAASVATEALSGNLSYQIKLAKMSVTQFGLLRTAMSALGGFLPLLIGEAVGAIFNLVTSQKEAINISDEYRDALTAVSGPADAAAEAVKRLKAEISSMSQVQLETALMFTETDFSQAASVLDKFKKIVFEFEAGIGDMSFDPAEISFPLHKAIDDFKAGTISIQEFQDAMAVAAKANIISRAEYNNILKAANELAAVAEHKRLIEEGLAGLGKEAVDTGDKVNKVGSSFQESFNNIDTDKIGKTIDDLTFKLSQFSRDAAGQETASIFLGMGIDPADIDASGRVMSEAMSKYKGITEESIGKVLELTGQIREAAKAHEAIDAAGAKITEFEQQFTAAMNQAKQPAERIREEMNSFRDAAAEAYGAAKMSAEEYQSTLARIAELEGIRLDELLGPALTELEQIKERLAGGEGSFTDAITVGLAGMVDDFTNVFQELSEISTDFFNGFNQGFGDSIGKAIVYGDDFRDSFGESMRSLAAQTISDLVQMGVQWAINSVLVKAFAQQKTAADAQMTASGVAAVQTQTATSTSAAAQTASAWAPAAATASIGSFGVAAAVAAAAIISVLALTSGFRKGGYTGSGSPNQIKGVVHAGEYVIPAPAVSRIGVPALQALASGRGFEPNVFDGNITAGGATQLNISIENYGSSKEFEVQQVTPDEVRIIARDVMRREVPGLVASDIANPNSLESKALARNTTASRRRSG